ncbi:acetyltransferase [Pontibacillus halophilus JSM 076056 = DSM 19796]|uniref:Acetyltransferase n=1 Tax=Pontibacillus halophilus JSM 076056 = DSM 19796 TaxID=1385510 RepID=A0A0A5GFT7_9BACI|nr:aminotransferase class V-fold PLP-dependent enzyme [Pontibacillus halophilus]KGX92106.1 acetyltransferase [Pontibacillus halophilus JSM 076056 = DSM 19796]
MSSIVYKEANEAEELAQIHQLNYNTFVNEIPQHRENDEHVLVDRFHNENTYIIAKEGHKVIGMVAVRASRPFSLDEKLPNLNEYLPHCGPFCEIRLLSILSNHRSSRVFFRLCETLVEYCIKNGYETALISGTTRQLKLYKRMGFIPFGELVGSKDAPYQPMYLTKETFRQSTRSFSKVIRKQEKHKETLSFLPGPVQSHPSVEDAFSKQPVSHRDQHVKELMTKAKKQLQEYTNANYSVLMVGTGTLANDAIASQLSTFKGEGLILINGEFGSRLRDHANRLNLSHYTIEKNWNIPITIEEIEQILDEQSSISWLWTVHCETSTGYIYDVEAIQRLCEQYGVEVCVDGCSSLGAIETNFKEMYLVSSVSGKALGAFPGLSIVLHREPLRPNATIPRYLDIGVYEQHGSLPYTHSSNLLDALTTSMTKRKSAETVAYVKSIRSILASNNIPVIGDDTYSPEVITIEIPEEVSSKSVGDYCKEQGIHISYESEYLIRNNWVQLACMGWFEQERIHKGLNTFMKLYHDKVTR